ncbi:MAG TPA: glycerophosphodiester phosphodiesterase [Burkholderiales bacterium]|jgi:glycerophosphoryl diester phosphodiesterase|nr:glycerophosphodiester phosphodiesterase [Burkholderiales bacterium]
MSPPRPLWPYPRVIAHRGAGALAPENTLAALRLGRNRGFRGVEFDVRLSGDGVPVLMHDETLERTTDGRGRVADTAYEVLQRLDAGGWFGNEFLGEPVPALAAAIALCQQSGLWANIELKPCPGREVEIGRAVARVVQLAGAGPQPHLLSSFSIEALEAAKQEAPRLPRGLLVEAPPGDWKARLDQLECVSLHADWRHLDRERVRQIHSAGFAVLAYTVNDSEAALQLLGWGVDALVTDQLDAIGPDFA